MLRVRAVEALRATLGHALAGVLACLLACAPALAQPDRFDVRSAFVEPAEGVWNLGVTLDLSLSGPAREALAESIPLDLRLDVLLKGERRFLPNETVAELEQRWRLSWDALSERYVVTNVNSGAQTNYASLELALESLSRVRGLPLIDASLLEDGRRYDISVRATVEIGDVPTALKVVLFWREWSRTTEWYTWSLRP